MNRICSMIACLAMLFCVVCGCRQDEKSLEDEIVALPDEWGMDVKEGATSNNFEMLSRVMAEANVSERIRLARLARGHFWHRPEWFVTNNVNPYHERLRFSFVCNCASRLISGKNATPETIIAGWKMDAEYLDDIEKLCELTDASLNVWQRTGKVTEGDSTKWRFANLVHREYEQYFKYQFSACVSSYENLPSSCRPAFVEQIKRDFFHRKGMALVGLNEFPPEFRK